MSTPAFFRARLDGMVDPSHPLAVLASRLPWDRIEAALAPKFARRDRPAQGERVDDLFGEREVERGGGVSNAGRPRLPIRLMASLLYLKHSFDLSDGELVLRWSENVVWQFFSGREYYEARPPSSVGVCLRRAYASNIRRMALDRSADLDALVLGCDPSVVHGRTTL